MHTRVRLSLALITAAVAAAPASAQEAIPLTFDWEPGLRAVVTQTMDQSSGTAGMIVEQRTVTRHVMETADHPQGLIVSFREGEMLESAAPTMQGVPGAEAFTRIIAEASYDMIVDEEGRLVEIQRDEATQEQLRSALEEMIEPLRSMQGAEGMTRMFEDMISNVALDSEAEQNWSSSVGLWAGDELVVGETYTSREEAPFPLMQNRTMVMDLETTLEGRVPCTEETGADECVRLVVRSAADPEDMRAMVGEMFEQMFAGSSMGMEIELGAFDQSSVVESIIDPRTLIPHTVTLTSSVEVEMTVMGQTMPTLQESVITMTYDWQDR